MTDRCITFTPCISVHICNNVLYLYVFPLYLYIFVSLYHALMYYISVDLFVWAYLIVSKFIFVSVCLTLYKCFSPCISVSHLDQGYVVVLSLLASTAHASFFLFSIFICVFATVIIEINVSINCPRPLLPLVFVFVVAIRLHQVFTWNEPCHNRFWRHLNVIDWIPGWELGWSQVVPS